MKPSFCAHCIDNEPVKKVGKFWLCATCAPEFAAKRLSSTGPSSSGKRGHQVGGAGYLPTADQQDEGWGRE